MNQVNRIISLYSADVFGAVSALFELGGMIVIHDPSGCNSTYTTHDEPRWFDSKTLLYISALTEKNAILGNDKRFINDVTETALLQKPAFIALLSAQMPAMLGIDMNGIAKVIEKNTNIKTFALPTTSMHDYSIGISLAIEKITDIIIEETNNPCSVKKRRGVNILGATPLDFYINGEDKAIINFFEKNNISVISTFSMNTDMETLKKAHNAERNIVVTYGGLAAAKAMKAAWNIPYIIGLPIGKTGESILNMIKTKKSGVAYKSYAKSSCKKTYLIHESVIAASLANALENEINDKITVINMTTTKKELMREGDEIFQNEDELEAKFKTADLIIADPMYRPIAGDTKFISLPHTAFSGRTYTVSRFIDLLVRIKKGAVKKTKFYFFHSPIIL